MDIGTGVQFFDVLYRSSREPGTVGFFEYQADRNEHNDAAAMAERVGIDLSTSTLVIPGGFPHYVSTSPSGQTVAELDAAIRSKSEGSGVSASVIASKWGDPLLGSSRPRERTDVNRLGLVMDYSPERVSSLREFYCGLQKMELKRTAARAGYEVMTGESREYPSYEGRARTFWPGEGGPLTMGVDFHYTRHALQTPENNLRFIAVADPTEREIAAAEKLCEGRMFWLDKSHQTEDGRFCRRSGMASFITGLRTPEIEASVRWYGDDTVPEARGLYENLKGVFADAQRRAMEAYGDGHGGMRSSLRSEQTFAFGDELIRGELSFRGLNGG